jgi:catechol 2,3-dioxygenase-like lactoylglutathione lyase family enzyme
MLEIEAVDHVGIRVSDKDRAIAFYQRLGFGLVRDVGFEDGHPVIMRHASGVVLNLLGPATKGAGENILMDVADKYPGITHVALRVASEAAARDFCAAQNIPITGQFRFGAMSAIFIRDPDRNVIELDAYTTEDADPRAYDEHP